MHGKNGYIIIESIIAITLGVVGLLGVLTLLQKALTLNKDISNKLTATYLAAEGIEIIRHLVDVNSVSCPRNQEWNARISDGSYQVDFETALTGANNIVAGRITTADGMSDDPLSFDSSSGVYSYSGGNPTGFLRTIFIRSDDDVGGVPQQLAVQSIVTWPPRDDTHTVRLEDHFYNWRSLRGVLPPCR